MQTEAPEVVRRMILENPVVIFSSSTCYLCLSVKRLFHGMGVNTTVFEIDKEPELEKDLLRIQIGAYKAVPVVFVGGKLVGSVDRVIASLISGNLVPLLKDAGALWL